MLSVMAASLLPPHYTGPHTPLGWGQPLGRSNLVGTAVHEPDPPPQGLFETRASELRLQAVLSVWRRLCGTRHPHLAAAVLWQPDDSDGVLATRLAYP